MTLLTAKNQAYANVRTFGLTVLVDFIYSSHWVDTLIRKIRDDVQLNPLDCLELTIGAHTNIREQIEDPEKGYDECPVLFVRMKKEALTHGMTPGSVVDFRSLVLERRRKKNLSTFVILYGNPIAEDADICQRLTYGPMGLISACDVGVKATSALHRGPDALVFYNQAKTSGDICDLLNRDREFDVDDWENVAFLDIDGTVLVGRTFIRTQWSGTRACLFADDPVREMRHMDQELLEFIRRLSHAKKVKWVLSSVWRLLWSHEDVKMFGKILGIPMVGRTERGSTRAEEITSWLDEHQPGGKIMTLDDESFEVQGATHVRVDPLNGVSWTDMETISGIFDASVYDFTSRSSRACIPHHDPGMVTA